MLCQAKIGIREKRRIKRAMTSVVSLWFFSIIHITIYCLYIYIIPFYFIFSHTSPNKDCEMPGTVRRPWLVIRRTAFRPNIFAPNGWLGVEDQLPTYTYLILSYYTTLFLLKKNPPYTTRLRTLPLIMTRTEMGLVSILSKDVASGCRARCKSIRRCVFKRKRAPLMSNSFTLSRIRFFAPLFHYQKNTCWVG